MSTSTTASLLEQRLREAVQAKPAVSSVAEAKALFATAGAKIEVPKGKKEYAEIVGEAHPSGKQYYFTVYSVDDWDEAVRHLIPEVDERHVFDHNYTLAILIGIEYNKVVFAYGPPGSGKSVTPAQVCARINYPFMFIAGMGGTEPSDYVGSPWVKDGSMEWKDGPLSWAVRHGVFLLYDEPFKSSAQTNMCIQSLLDTRRTLKLYGHPDPINGSLVAHPKFRMALADNVRGFGDDMDKYAAEVQDQSTLNRAPYKVHVDYVPASVEKDLLQRAYPDATEQLIHCVVQLGNQIREGWKKGEFTAPYSIRDTKEMVEASLLFQSPAEAFKFTYFGAIKDTAEAEALRKIWQSVFGKAVPL